MTIFRILRNIPEVFEVEADSYEQVVGKIHDGYIEESESLLDIYELVESWEKPNEKTETVNNS